MSTGKNKGKRFHRALTILKEWGASDPQWLAALWTNEVVTNVTITFWQKDANGADQQKTQITLTDAYIVKSRMFTGDANTDNSSAATSKNASEYDTMELQRDQHLLRQDPGRGHARQDDGRGLVERLDPGRRVKTRLSAAC